MHSTITVLKVTLVMLSFWAPRALASTTIDDLEGNYKGSYSQQNKKEQNKESGIAIKWDSAVEMDGVKAKVKKVDAGEFLLKIKGTVVTKTVKCLIQMQDEQQFTVPPFEWKNKILVGQGQFVQDTLEIRFLIEGTEEVVVTYLGKKQE